MTGRKLRKLIFAFGLAAIMLYGVSKAYPKNTPSLTGHTTANIEYSEKEPIVLFCPRDNCGGNLEYLLNRSAKAHCAFFDLDLENVIAQFDARYGDSRLAVIDADNFMKGWENKTNLRKDSRKAFMHNKFCVIDDEIVWTGSMNPTHNCDEKNNNNAVIIYSKALARNYEDEFQELWKGVFGKGAKVENPIIDLNGTIIESYFCPEDYCANIEMKEFSKANESIYFMTFSFTHQKEGDLVKKRYLEGIDVKGVFEKTQNSKYSQYWKLNQSGAPVKLDTNPAMMHHKVWIIDRKVVITGSFNPTMNGDTANDENILIIRSEKIAKKYLEEFELVYGEKI
ncbi:hypothetical protein COV19_06005 [Candidatus Woesearchaeota archaeon CG10_big_fil_rev_8_21_14_0_10_44_13]|nr:MAG: hypothetical protein COV19_06005 [Candidatus Woesearchaeota archaeon CG10_big_fil_rev_8_21_14_0_10_44_13]